MLCFIEIMNILDKLTSKAGELGQLNCPKYKFLRPLQLIRITDFFQNNFWVVRTPLGL